MRFKSKDPGVAPHLPAMRRFARSLTRDASTADDLVHDAVVRAIEQGARFRPEAELRPWLMAITHNLFIDGWRKDRRRAAANAELMEGESAAPPSQETAAELSSALRAFDALPDEQKAVMHLVAIEGLSYAEAAQALDVPVGTVMSRLSRAREAMRALRAKGTAKPEAPQLRLVRGRDD